MLGRDISSIRYLSYCNNIPLPLAACAFTLDGEVFVVDGLIAFALSKLLIALHCIVCVCSTYIVEPTINYAHKLGQTSRYSNVVYSVGI